MQRLTLGLKFFFFTLLLFTVFRGIFFFIYQDYFTPLSNEQILTAFLHGVRFDIAAIFIAYVVPLGLLFLPFEFAERQVWMKFCAWLLSICLVVMTLLFIADLIYFEHGKRHIGRELTLIANDLGYFAKMAVSIYIPHLIAFVLATIGFIFLTRYFLRNVTNKLTSDLFRGALFFIGLTVMVIGIRGGFLEGHKLNIVDAYTFGDEKIAHLVLNPSFSAYHSNAWSSSESYQFYDEKQLDALKQKYVRNDNLKYPFLRHYTDNKPTNYNVVIVVLESWTAHYVDSYGDNDYGVTPNFDRIVSQGIQAQQYYSVGQASTYGLQGVLTSTPIIPGTPSIGYGLSLMKIPLIGKLAQQYGYHTVFAQSSRRRSFSVDAIAYAVGFQEVYGMEDMTLVLDYPDPDESLYGWDYETYMLLKNRLDEIKQPFLATVFTGTTHWPFAKMPKEFQKKYFDGSRENRENGYLNTLLYADWSLGEFMKAAEKSEWYDNTIFVFTADHPSNTVEITGFPNRFHSPFAIYAPGIIKPQSIEVTASQLDILPTVMDLLGFQEPFPAFGESLFRKQDNYALVISSDGLAGMITDKGYIRHSLEAVLEAQSFNSKEPEDDAYFAEVEQQLLMWYQLIYEALDTNTMSP